MSMYPVTHMRLDNELRDPPRCPNPSNQRHVCLFFTRRAKLEISKLPKTHRLQARFSTTHVQLFD